MGLETKQEVRLGPLLFKGISLREPGVSNGLLGGEDSKYIGVDLSLKSANP